MHVRTGRGQCGDPWLRGAEPRRYQQSDRLAASADLPSGGRAPRVRRCAFWSDRYGSRGSASADRMPRYRRSRRHRHPIRPRRGARVLRARCSGAQCASGVTPTRAPRPPKGSVSHAFAFPGRSRAEPRMVAGRVQHAPPRRVPWRAAGGREPCRGHDDPCTHAPRGVTKETAMIPDAWRTQVCRKSRVSHSVSLP